MKRATFLLSLAVLAHLSVVDMVYYFLGSVISVNFTVIFAYNVVWLIVAIMIGNQVYNEPKS